ncbi:RNA-guided endonuclease InsQ/TnpB family protein [Paraburkholderia phenoliruptrix]|uniref:RNA-guided endonuclease InsQ/TnpB family protein n=1 Tax=Paraburkholderia phenoliruptrix TaxID=252970 RepID=UPI0028698BA9|nr:transposase [Paraburkholderia phenoliruptrix]WMY10973.1 transposase [Paraburkholderia phenoliruptrix]
MRRLQASKFELMPTGEQARKMRQFGGACRFVYNKALALQQERYAAGQKKLGYSGLCKLLTGWRNSAQTPWLADAPVHSSQQALKDLERAYVNFFAKRAAFPRFKRKGSSDSFRFPDPKGIKLEQGNSRLFLPKLGYVRYRNSRPVLGEVRNVTVSQSGGKWFASIQTQREVDMPLPTATSAIGVDVGIARFATLSDGSNIAPLNSFKKHEKRLARYQRRMARKKNFSRNWKKAKARLQKIHTDVANARRDFLHKASATISKNHALVCIEDLQVLNMSKSARGTIEAPGKNVRAKAGLNKAILDQGWGEFRRQLEYKMAWSGGMLLPVPAHNTSRTCPCCAHVAKENRKTQARFACVSCGYENHADVVGAINILERGQRLLACADSSPEVRASWQEPAEATT